MSENKEKIKSELNELVALGSFILYDRCIEKEKTPRKEPKIVTELKLYKEFKEKHISFNSLPYIKS